MRYSILMVALVVPASLCAAENSPPAAEPVTTPETALLDPVFDCFRVNTAWGFALSGTMVDRSGGIYRYSTRGKGWAPPSTQVDGATYYRDADLRAKFADAKGDGSVDAQALAENAALIVKSAEGRIQRADTGTRDAGSSTCHAYIHDETRQRYRDVELGSDGGVSDMRDSNDAAAAQTLLMWLKSIDVAH
jgi:hypothetical protein